MLSPRTSRPRSGRPALSFAAAVGLGLAATAPPALGGDPFAAGLRWTRAAGPDESWIPKSVALGAADNLVWFAAAGGAPHLEVCAAPGAGEQAPLWRDDAFHEASGAFAVAAGSASGAFYSVAQFPAPDALHRRTVLARHAPVAAAEGQPFAAAWQREIGPPTNGAARLACSADGAVVAAAAWNEAARAVLVRWFEGERGLAIGAASLAAPRLDEIAISADGSRLAVAAGASLCVFDAQGAVVDAQPLAFACGSLALSEGGARLAFAAAHQVRVQAARGSGYAELFDVEAPPGDTAVRVVLSRDGATLAIGWWKASGTGLRFELWDVPSRARIFELAQDAGAGGLQNLPAAIAIDPAGARIAFGSWGDGELAPEVVLVDRASAAVVLAIDLPGSVQALAIDATGTRVAVAHKDAHANVLSSSGAVRLYDTGERDLVALELARAGERLPLAAKKPGASFCLFLQGEPGPPATFPGTFGELSLVRRTLQVFPRACDAQGRADLELFLPPDPVTIGTELHLQGAFRVGGALHFGAARIDPLVL